MPSEGVRDACRRAMLDCRDHGHIILFLRRKRMSYDRLSPPPSLEDADVVIAATRRWLERAVIGLNLCPFAKSVHVKGQVRYVVTPATANDALRAALEHELALLAAADPTVTDTTLLIHPGVLREFFAYNDFLEDAERVVRRMGLEGALQVASFHPDYVFADSASDDMANFTNRSPYPMLHLLREESIDRAVEAFPDAAAIYERNIETMRHLGPEGWRALWAQDD